MKRGPKGPDRAVVGEFWRIEFSKEVQDLLALKTFDRETSDIPGRTSATGSCETCRPTTP